MFLTLHSSLFLLITCINLIIFIVKNNKTKFEKNKSISLFFHLYYCIMVSFYFQDDDLIQCSYIYFIADSILNLYFDTFKTFNKYHHLFAFTLLIFNEHLDRYLINQTGVLEISTIVLCLIDLQLINKTMFEILFPISFVFCRLLLFNFLIFQYLWTINFQVSYFTLITIVLLNSMNLGIAIKMRLFTKIVVIFY